MFNSIHGTAPMNLCNSMVMACEANDINTHINDTLQVYVPDARDMYFAIFIMLTSVRIRIYTSSCVSFCTYMSIFKNIW